MKSIIGIFFTALGLFISLNSLGQGNTVSGNSFAFSASQEKIDKANAKSFPVNLTSENFSSIKKFKKKTVGFEGIIVDKQISKQNTPFYKIKLDDNNFLWTVLMFKNDLTQIGSRVRILGYLNDNLKPNEKEKYLEGKFIAIGLGMVDYQNELYIFPNGLDSQKQEWLNGIIPSSK